MGTGVGGAFDSVTLETPAILLSIFFEAETGFETTEVEASVLGASSLGFLVGVTVEGASLPLFLSSSRFLFSRTVFVSAGC